MPFSLKRGLTLPYRATEIFDLVADIESYPEFVPGWHDSRIVDYNPRRVVVEQLVNIGPAKQRFITEARLDRPHKIDIRSRDAPFGKLDIHWSFKKLDENGCTATFLAQYEAKSWVLQKLVSGLIEERLLRIVDAFETRAHAKYGNPNRTNRV